MHQCFDNQDLPVKIPGPVEAGLILLVPGIRDDRTCMSAVPGREEVLAQPGLAAVISSRIKWQMVTIKASTVTL